jgi:hypothetical protein
MAGVLALAAVPTLAPAKTSPQPAPRGTVLVLGDSLSAGYGLTSGQSWVALTAQRLPATHPGWKLVNDCYQIRGGRGYETQRSLAERGEIPYPAERLLRDFRINTVVEGSSQIMHLFIAREALDARASAAGALLDPKAGFGARLKATWRAAKFYARWYPPLWFGRGMIPTAFPQYGPLARHVRWLERTARRLARSIFHCMVVQRARLERRQRLLARVVDAGAELMAMASACAKARTMAYSPDGDSKPIEVADAVGRGARRRVGELLRGLRGNDDARTWKLAQSVVAGEHSWLEEGILDFHELATAAAPATVQPESAPRSEPATSARA